MDRRMELAPEALARYFGVLKVGTSGSSSSSNVAREPDTASGSGSVVADASGAAGEPGTPLAAEDGGGAAAAHRCGFKDPKALFFWASSVFSRAISDLDGVEPLMLAAMALQAAAGPEAMKDGHEKWLQAVAEAAVDFKFGDEELAMASLVLYDVMRNEDAIEEKLGADFSGADRVLHKEEPESFSGQELAAGVLMFVRERYFPSKSVKGSRGDALTPEAAERISEIQVRLQFAHLALTKHNAVSIAATSGAGKAEKAAAVVQEMSQNWLEESLAGELKPKAFSVWWSAELLPLGEVLVPEKEKEKPAKSKNKPGRKPGICVVGGKMVEVVYVTKGQGRGKARGCVGRVQRS
eukprot:g16849.t1